MSELLSPDNKGESQGMINYVKAFRNGNSLFQLPVQDSNETHSNFLKLRVAELSCCLLAIVGFGVGAIIYDLIYPKNTYEEKKDLVDMLFFISSLSTGLLLLSIIWRTFAEFEWLKSKGVHASGDSLFSTEKIPKLVSELIVNAMHPVWFLGRDTFSQENVVYPELGIEYQYNAILSMVTLLRFYHCVRVLSILSIYRSGRAQRICIMNGSEARSSYAIKCLMKEQPLLLVSSMMIIGILIGGYCLRILERPLVIQSGMDFSKYSNAMWCIILTMTTVGYGDYYPVTVGGRLVGFISCIWGVLVVSLMVVSLTNLLMLESGEDKALTLLKRLNFKKETQQSAAAVIGSAFKLRCWIKKYPNDTKTHNILLGKLKKHVMTFNRTKMKLKSLYNLDSPFDRIERKLNKIEDSIEEDKEFLGKTLARLNALKK